MPSLFSDMPLETFQRLVRERVEERVAQLRAELAREARPFMGRERVMRQNPRRSAGDAFPDFALDPRLAGREDAPIEAKAELVGWRAAYREAYELWRAGRRRVEFPRGTYGMRVFHAALVAPT